MTQSGPGGHDFVRPFIMTGGRTASVRDDLRLETLVRRVPEAEVDGRMASEKMDLLRSCETPTSVAELGAELSLVVGVVKVLIEDLVESGHVEVFIDTVEPAEDNDFSDELDLLTRISDKIRSL
ncbi:MAG: DUF742 domain-containing protein [Microthrixaceae bacterium]|nr:DUF742 domain-containing protein [Acidimicrobiales bacterium]MCB9402910.1 DUF742 domain-containing protein [Microthrixaceae bacterium]